MAFQFSVGASHLHVMIASILSDHLVQRVVSPQDSIPHVCRAAICYLTPNVTSRHLTTSLLRPRELPRRTRCRRYLNQ